MRKTRIFNEFYIEKAKVYYDCQEFIIDLHSRKRVSDIRK